MDLASRLKIKNNEHIILGNSIEKILSDIRTLFSYKNFKPIIQFSYAEKSFHVDYSSYFKNNTLAFLYSVDKKNVSVTPLLFSDKNKTQCGENFLYFLKESNALSNIAFDFNNDTFCQFFTDFVRITHEINTIEQQITGLKRKIKFAKNTLKMQPFFKLLPRINDFCIDSFLCKEFNIQTNNNTPTEDNILELKKHILTTVNTDFIRFNFVKYEQTRYSMEFIVLKMAISTTNGRITVKTKNKVLTSKKSINKILGQQFLFNNKIVNKSNIENNIHLKTFFGNNFLNEYSDNTISFELINKKIKALKTANLIHEF